MMKAGKVAVALLAIAGGGNASMAQGNFQDYEVYNYTFYDDAAHSNVFGHGQTRCDGRFDYSGTYYITSGQNSGFYDMDLAAICTEHGLAPY